MGLLPALALSLIAIVLWQRDAVNRRIDLCDDPTWGKYVWNDELRHKTRAPTPLVTPVSR
ncbi:hypothetical protein DNR46_05050 [Mesorhizobium japonicum]|uniref:Uncharacterized protein n=1 Tax=Mesorhizobium japonicum TaxID=2066070 RepID=A0A3M9XGN6_9HYPH|nr:hypothetical protein DNR46_05050 [Mesorhizobium japonicum]